MNVAVKSLWLTAVSGLVNSKGQEGVILRTRGCLIAGRGESNTVDRRPFDSTGKRELYCRLGFLIAGARGSYTVYRRLSDSNRKREPYCVDGGYLIVEARWNYTVG